MTENDEINYEARAWRRLRSEFSRLEHDLSGKKEEYENMADPKLDIEIKTLNHMIEEISNLNKMGLSRLSKIEYNCKHNEDESLLGGFIDDRGWAICHSCGGMVNTNLPNKRLPKYMLDDPLFHEKFGPFD